VNSVVKKAGTVAGEVMRSIVREVMVGLDGVNTCICGGASRTIAAT
jgi:hypothetical protein